LHFTAFHPDFRLRDRPHTPPETLVQCYELARSHGLNYVYTGNVNDVRHQSTYCPQCRTVLVERNWYQLGQYNLNGSHCGKCGQEIAGRFDSAPGSWGARRQPVRIADFAPPRPPRQVIPPGALQMTATPAAPANETRYPLPQPTPDEGRSLLRAATSFVVSALTRQPQTPIDPQLATLAQQPIFGAFVSVKRHHHLRSCCGFLGQYVPLLQGVQHAAGRTANDDPRFPPVSLSEVPFLDIEVWLLDQSQLVSASGRDRIAAVTIGRHGLQIARGNQSGLLLPGVAVENGWNSEQFLQQVCHKAGLPTTAWLDADTRLSTFEGWSIKRPVAELDVNVANLRNPLPLERNDLAPLARHAGQNVVNLIRGAAANPYLSGGRDANVCGLVLMVEGVNIGQRMEVSRLDLRPNLPLQATLFELSQAVAQHLGQRGDLARWFEQLRVGLTVLCDTALHGTVADADLRGVIPAERGLMVMEGPRHALLYDPTQSAEQLLSEAKQIVQPGRPEFAPINSFAIISTEARVVVRQVPPAAAASPAAIAPASGSSIRPAAQAGRFYPADLNELSRMLDDFWRRPVPAARHFAACMVPHAGLIYSGRIAADVLRRIEIPETVVIIGPKHTPHGINWAIAPHERWAIPGGEVQADLELSRALEQGIDGLQFDAAAHQQEHGIEVELPLLAKLAPRTKLVAITIGSGDVEQCRRFGQQLADVVRKLPKPPLLVISSDMNHFADDAENRRLDRLALDAMDKLDPAALFDVCTSHNISMCGMRPAVIVMEALRQLGGLKTIEHVGYATSADVSGDTSRVVGYAGALLK
jgi:AmmeMemoRadiSam system protein B/AmmeMemoRadiSam system protein A